MNGNAAVVIVSTTTATDDYGDSTTTTTETPWPGCMVAPRYATEASDNRSPGVVIGKSALGPLPAGVTLDSDDQIKVDGVLYDIDGEAGDWKSPFTDWRPGVEVALKRTTGV